MARIHNFSMQHRTLLVGMSGSGKTVASKKLLETYYEAIKHTDIPIIIIDSKYSDDFFCYKSLGTIYEGAEPPKIPKIKPGKNFFIWRTLADDIDTYEIFLHDLFLKRKPFILYIDELSSMTSASGRSYPRSLDLILKQGRQLSMTVLCATQSPSSIPKSCLAQTTNLFRFHLVDLYDISKLSKIMGRVVEQSPPDDYGFYFKNVSKGRTQTLYYKNMQEFFGI